MSQTRTFRKARPDFLSAAEEAELGQQILEGSQRARNTLVVKYRPLVTPIAKKFVRWGQIDLDDLVSEGYMGLMRAADSYDYRLGRFGTYAQWWVRDRIRTFALEQGRDIRIPQSARLFLKEIQKAEQAFIEENGREATAVELAAKLDITADKLRAHLSRARVSMVWLDRPISNEGAGTLVDFLPDSNGLSPEDSVTNPARRFCTR
jgi:RNA polymerase primary sigma factor